MAIKLTAQAQIMTFLHLMSVLNIWPRRPRENKVEILTCFYITERSNLEDSSSYGGSDSGYRGGSSGYGGGGGRRVWGKQVWWRTTVLSATPLVQKGETATKAMAE